eukprot:scaffold20065_cov60-Phaeocystis_antarctica.AAC.3
MLVTCPTSHALRSSSNVERHVTPYRRDAMSVTALTSHAEIRPCVACATAASAHHSPSATWRLALSLNADAGGEAGGSGGDSGDGGGVGGGGGGGGGSEGLLQVTEAQSECLCQSLKAFASLNIADMSLTWPTSHDATGWLKYCA